MESCDAGHMGGHVFVRLEGPGLWILPFGTPWHVRIRGDRVTLTLAELGRRASFRVEGGELFDIELEGASAISEVLDFEPRSEGERTTGWWGRTANLAFPIPPGLTAFEEREDGPVLAYLSAAEDEEATMFVQGPWQTPEPSPAEVVAPDAKRVGRGTIEESSWIEVEYGHDGVTWRQRVAIVVRDGAFALVTAQAPSASMGKLKAGFEAVVRGLVFPLS